MREKVPERLEYQPALDGLRALAIIAVIVFHNSRGIGFGRGGFLGVDIFFVLSGFLITSLLLIDHSNTGHVVSGRFWARRARRLLPALFVLLAIQALVAAFIAKPWELHTIRNGSIATLFYVTNYWSLIAKESTKNLVLGHTWSLAIEEQFYLVWPLVLALILRVTRGSTAWIMGILGTLIIGSSVLMAWLYSPKNPYPAYTRIDARAHSLLAGAVIAFLLLGWKGPARRGTRVALEVVGLAALAVVIFLMITVEFFAARWLFYGGYLALAIATAVLIAAAVQPSSPVLGRVLSVRPLVAIGLISYGLYLFHIPVFRVLDESRTGLDGLPLFIVRLAVVIPIALASYFFIEMPIRRGALTWHRMRVVAPAVAVMLVVFFVGATVRSRSITPDALSKLAYERVSLAAPAGSTRVLVFGNDALAFSLGNTLSGRFLGRGVYGTTVTIYGCSIVSGTKVVAQEKACTDWSKLYRSAVDGFRPDAAVLVISATEIFDRVEDGRKLEVGTPEYETFMLDRLEEARVVLTRHGAPLVLLTTGCGTDPGSTWVNGVLRKFAADHPDSVHIGDYAEFVCPDGKARDTINGDPVFAANGVSLTPTATLETWGWLAETPPIADLIESHAKT